MPVTALSTDLYQLTMLAGYFQTGRHLSSATFELFVRRLPRNRSCLIAAGLEQAVQYIETLAFSADEVAFIREQPSFRAVGPAFFDYLHAFRFTGDVWAMREGTPFFPNEPILRVTAPLAEAQLLETTLLAIINFQTSIASKAHRIVQAAGDRPVLEFGARRAHGIEAALLAARAAYIAGVSGSSFVEAGRQFGIPLSGTMAHSWILAAPTERDAFTDYARIFDPHTVLLLDTYDVDSALRTAIDGGLRPAGVRIDSGDLLSLSRIARARLDAAGLTSTRVIVSGDLDEWKIDALMRAGAPIDSYAVGTALVTSDDAPALGGVYKLVEIESGGVMRGVMKRSVGKSTWPGRKQVWRVIESGVAVRDMITLAADRSGLGDSRPAGTFSEVGVPLLEPVLRGGRRVSSPVTLEGARSHRADMVATLPVGFRELPAPVDYVVERSAAIQ